MRFVPMVLAMGLAGVLPYAFDLSGLLQFATYFLACAWLGMVSGALWGLK